MDDTVMNAAPASAAEIRKFVDVQSGGGAGVQASVVEVIEDDQPLATVLSEGLEARGYRTILAPDAPAALELARARGPDLILCDIDMPGKNGHRVLQDFRADPELADCQFVFMTGNSVYAKPRVGMNLGADDFLLKPFTLDDLVSCVSARLQRATLSRRREEQMVRNLREHLHSTLPHEFFTPLSGIMGLADLMDEEAEVMEAREIRRVVRDIRRSSQRLCRTLRNYLNFLALDDESEPETKVWLGATEVVDAIAVGAQTAAARHERPKELVTELTGAPVAIAPADLSLVVEELVDNGFRFSTGGAIVRVKSWADEKDLHVTVADSGRGMSSQQLREVGAFHQFERKRYEQQGLGIGLELVRRLVRRNAGRFTIDSVPGERTICRLSFPRSPCPQAG